MSVEVNSLRPRLEADHESLLAELRNLGAGAIELWKALIPLAADRALPGWCWERQLAVNDAAIAHLVALAEARRGQDSVVADGLLDQANVWSFNVAADLAPCWPGDELPRERVHLQAGLAAAMNCLAWRQQLGKGDFPFALAWWARGIHELFLGLPEARSSFQRAADHGRALAIAQQRSTGIDGNAVYMHLLNEGCAAIAALRQGDSSGGQVLRSVLEAFDEQARLHPGEAEDAAFGQGQLRCAAERLGLGF